MQPAWGFFHWERALLNSPAPKARSHTAPPPFNSLWTNTMNRCKKYLHTLLLAACTLGVLAPLAASAQTNNSGVREFPKAALRGKLVVTAPPEVTLNGKADRLSPGSRIRNTQSLTVMSVAIVGQELTVN